MGNNTLETILGGIGRKEQVNQYKEALVGDILPRNANGEVEALAANLGSVSVPFKELHATVINRGTARKKKEFLTAGSYSFNVPDGVTEVKVILAGGGGGGSISVGSGTPAFGGGHGAGACVLIVPVSSGDILSGSVGAGGSGAYSTGAALLAGNAGSQTTVSKNGISLAAALGGGGGSTGLFSTTCGGVTVNDMSNLIASSSGGVGSVANFHSQSTGGLTGKGGVGLWAGGGSIGNGGIGYNNNGYTTGGGGGYSNGGNGSNSKGPWVGGAGGNGGAIIYYDLPSWATDPNNGVDA